MHSRVRGKEGRREEEGSYGRGELKLVVVVARGLIFLAWTSLFKQLWRA